MKKNYPNLLVLYALVLLCFGLSRVSAQTFTQNNINLNGFGNIGATTSLMYGPDDRLYVATYTGLIRILTIERSVNGQYNVLDIETLNDIRAIVNHDDDGGPCSGAASACNLRETTGIAVGGTSENPVFYVSSSDFRIGGGLGGGVGDVDLDTNSGTITRFSWNGTSWDVVDIVRGLSRSEENHATNGLEITNINGTNYLIVASGGNTNAGSPSTNFTFITEYALAGAVLSINLDMLETMPILSDNGRQFIYDIPTLDDPTRANANGINDPDAAGYDGIDINDPFGGNDGLNQAKIVPGGPVQIFSPGYRNAFDLVVTESGALYVTDNGANLGWGGLPANEGGGGATNFYDPSEPGSQTQTGGELIDNVDHLQLVTTDIQTYVPGSLYGGHPNPVRANPAGAGLFTVDGNDPDLGVFRTQVYDPDGSTLNSVTDPALALPADWPPVPVNLANTVEGDWRGPTVTNPDGPEDNPVLTWSTNTNGIDEYTASNFGGILKGNLIAGHNLFGGNLRRVELNPDGSEANFTPRFLDGVGGNPLGVSCNGDNEIFPGTIWVGTLNGNIIVYEPTDLVNCLEPTDPGYDPLADGDLDGYSNQDEEDNLTDVCNGGSRPQDFDFGAGGVLISDLNDTDDDADGIADAQDSFQLGDITITGSDAFTIPITNDLFNDQEGLGGFLGLGMTGLMNNGDTAANWLDWIDRRDDPNDPNPNDVLGGAPGIMTSHMTSGTATGAINNQDKGFQYGVQVDENSTPFSVVGGMNGFTGPLRLYGNTAALGGELGFFIGDGTQSDFIKFVVSVDGFLIQQEINDVPQTGTQIVSNLPVAERPDSNIRFYFIVNPANGEVEFQHQIDNGDRVSLGTMIAEGNVLQAIQSNTTDLAVGFNGTSNTPGVELEGSWDFLDVIGEEPQVSEGIADISVTIGAPDELIFLNNVFIDDNGTQNLVYTIEGNTNPAIVPVLINDELTISFPDFPGNSIITIRATDEDGFFVDDSFEVEVVEDGIVLHRVNAGGPTVLAIDGDLDWGEDTLDENSQFLANPGNNRTFEGNVNTTDTSVDTATTPFEIFETERFDEFPGAPNLSYSFPVNGSGNYEIRLYMGNGFAETALPGQRIFDVEIEGLNYPLLSDIDLSDTFGHQVGAVISHIINITDGAIDITFVHNAFENPLINAIEILDVEDFNTPIYVFDIDDLTSNVGAQLDGSLSVNALGGDGNLQYSAVNLPPGITIEPTNGQLGGTPTIEGVEQGPYDVVITIDDGDAIDTDVVQVAFQWTIIDPTLVRINAGGQLVTATDNGPNWVSNANSGPSFGDGYFVNTGVVFGSDFDFDAKHSSIPAYIDEDTYVSIFGDNRFDLPSVPEMEFSIPLSNDEFVVHIYFGDSFIGTSQVGERTFDVLLEGNTVLSNFDIVEAFGHASGGMIAFPVTLTDGELNIAFAHQIENPTVNAIEIYRIDTTNPVLTVDPIADRVDQIGNAIDFAANAAGGNPNNTQTYFISGQPEGISIDPLTGQISGFIQNNAVAGGPEGNGLHLVRVTAVREGSAPSTVIFNWDIPSTASWTSLDEDENYTARHESSFVQAGDKFYSMGGRENAQTVDVYDYTSDTWVALVDSAPFEFNHFQATEYQGLIWVIAAFNNNSFPNETPTEFVWMFDPVNEEWIQGPQIPQNRRRGGAGIVVFNDKFYVLGGNADGHDGGFVSWFDEFDPATGVWSEMADAPHARDHFAAVLIDNQLYAAGGRLSGGAGGVFAPTVPEVDVFDFTTGTWSTLPETQNIPTSRAGASAVNFNDNLIVIGGEVQNELVYGELTTGALQITEGYNPVNQTWERLPDMNFERHGTQGIVSGNGIFTAGGSDQLGGGNQLNMEVFGDNSPVGAPSVSSLIEVPNTVIIEDGTTQSFEVNLIEGNVGIFVTSIEITGADAADFSIVSGDLQNMLLSVGATHPIEVALAGTGANRTALLTIHYGVSESISVILTNSPDVEFSTSNPGNQFNAEGDQVNLQIEAASGNPLTYSASNLPPTLTINPTTGVISGTIEDGTCIPGEAFIEQNGLVVIEAESGTLSGNWSLDTFGDVEAIVGGGDHFGNPLAGGNITYQVTINTPGVYRVNWRSSFTGPSPTDKNDSWLRLPNTDDVWFFGIDNSSGNPGTEADIIALLQSGSTTDLVFPRGSGRESGGETSTLNANNNVIDEDQGTVPHGQGSNNYFKAFRSGGNSEAFDWQVRTSDFDAHDIYVWFVNPGTYTMDISERSLGHAIDRVALYKVDTFGLNANQFTNTPESPNCIAGVGAAENSPYNVTVTVTDETDGVSEEINFTWVVGENGELIAVPEADVTSGFAPLTVNFTGSNSVDDVGVTSYEWDFGDGTTSTEADPPPHTYTSPGIFTVSLTVMDADGNTSTNSIEIEVEQISVTGVTVNPNVAVLAPNETLQLEAGVLPVNATNQDVTWVSSDESVVTVDENGVITAVGLGEAIVSVSTDDGGFSADASIAVGIPVTGITVDPVSLEIIEGNTGQLTATVTPADATNQNVIWTSSDESIATVDVNGVVIGIAPGQVQIIATTEDGGFTAEANIIVTPVIIPVEGVVVNPANISIELGTTTELVATINPADATDQSVTWTSSDENIATVDENGVVTTVGPGQVTITATTNDGGFTSEAEITVSSTVIAVTGVTVSPKNADIAVGADLALVAEVLPANATDQGVTWSSSDETIATVDANGIVTGIAVGEATIIVTTNDGAFTANALITVFTSQDNPPTAIATANPTEGEVPLPVLFDASQSSDDNGIMSYFWDFQNGSTSNEIDPLITFDQVGTYDVQLTVTDTAGQEDIAVITITVTEQGQNQAPIAIASATPISGDAPLEVFFTGSDSVDDVQVVSYFWDFNDGSTSEEANPTNVFTEVGTFTVLLTVTDAEGLTDTTEVVIVVTDPNQNNAPLAIASATPEEGTAPLEVTFTGSNSIDDSGVVSYFWDFGDGNSSTEADPIYTFTTEGTFVVTLTVEDAEGLSDSTTVTIIVQEEVEPEITGEMSIVIGQNPAEGGVARVAIFNMPSSTFPTQISVHDSAGRLITTYDPAEIFSDNLYQIPTFALGTELYYITFEFNDADTLGARLLVRN